MIKDQNIFASARDSRGSHTTRYFKARTPGKEFEPLLKSFAEQDSDLFKSIANALPHLVWSARADGYVDYYNERWYQFTGVAYGSTDGDAWRGVFHFEDQDRVWRAWRHSVESGDPYEVEYRLRNASGEYRWALARGLPIRDADGKILRWVGTCTDIHEQKENEERYSMAISHARVGFYDWDINKNLIIYSEQLKKDWGLPADLGAVPIQHVLKYIHPEDRARVEALIEETIQFKKPYATEYRVTRLDGKVIWADVHGTVTYAADGTPVRFFGTAIDITRRKNSEEALRRSEQEVREYAEAMPQMAFIADEAGKIVYFNQRHYEYFGVKPGVHEDWGWKDNVPAIHPDHLERTVKTWTEALETGKTYEIEYLLLRHDGVARWHLARANPIRDESGRIKRWFGTNTDIHEQKLAEVKLKEALEMRDEFLSVASHELKTPLSTLKLQAQFAKRLRDKKNPNAYSPANMDRLIDQTDKQVDRLTRLVDDMLDVARIRFGRLTIHPEPVDLQSFLSEINDRLAPIMRDANSPIIMDCKVFMEVRWDRMRMEQVLTNLLTNAMRYGDRTPVYLKAEASPTIRNAIRISVSDGGRGIAQEEKERIFKRFERVASSKDVSGLGLGLFITRQVVEAHGGKIWVESEGRSRGSTFIVEVPRSADEG